VAVSSTTASPACRLAVAHSPNFAMLIRRGGSIQTCSAFIPPASTYSLWMSRAMYLSISLVSSVPFMLHSFCLRLGTWIFPGTARQGRCGLELQLPIRAWPRLPSQISIRRCPNLVLSLSKGTRRALDFFQRNLSHSGCRTTQTPVLSLSKGSHPISAPAVVSPPGYADAISSRSTAERTSQASSF